MRVHNIFETVHNLGVDKKMKVCQKSPMYSHSNFRTFADLRMRVSAKSGKRACVFDLITLAKDIWSKKFKKLTP